MSLTVRSRLKNPRATLPERLPEREDRGNPLRPRLAERARHPPGIGFSHFRRLISGGRAELGAATATQRGITSGREPISEVVARFAL